jgi:hypothetical protein
MTPSCAELAVPNSNAVNGVPTTVTLLPAPEYTSNTVLAGIEIGAE